MYNNNNANNNDWCQKFSGKTLWPDFKDKLTFIKKTVLHTVLQLYCIQLLSCIAKLDKYCRIYLVLTKETRQKWHLWQDLLKSTSKVCKPSYDWMTWWRQQSEGISYILMEEYLNLWQILVKFWPTLIN